MQATLGGEMSESGAPAILVRYPVHTMNDAWVLPEGMVPASTTHQAMCLHLILLLQAWVRRSGRNARVVDNLAIRWLRENPGVGVDPDVCLLEPPPPEKHLRAVKFWKPGHFPPPLAFEVVSERRPEKNYKDYSTIQDRYAAMGGRELVVFDPLLAGPPSLGGPVLLQLWRRTSAGVLERVHFGEGPAYSEVLSAWLQPSTEILNISDDRAGQRLWQTGEEWERAEKERERAEKERAEAARLAAEARVKELEELLAKR